MTLRSPPSSSTRRRHLDIGRERPSTGPVTPFRSPSGLLGTIRGGLLLLRKPLTTAGVINTECLSPSGDGIAELGTQLQTETAIAEDACQLFGPTAPDPEEGETALRAADPDVTGGYYQPVVLRESTVDGDQYSVGITRLACGIGAASQELVVSYNQSYRRNENPSLDELSVDDETSSSTLRWDDTSVPTLSTLAGTRLTLTVSWPDCPDEGDCGDGICSIDESVDDCPGDCTTPAGCQGAGTYLMFETASRTLVTAREELRVSWYATAGEFEHERTGANVSGRANATSNHWTAPQDATTVRFWVVLRDDRRGVGWRTFDLSVANSVWTFHGYHRTFTIEVYKSRLMAHVLVIEDERDVADVIEYNLRSAGYVASVVTTGTDGLRVAREHLPDLVLLDLMLPDRAGTEVCRLLKESPDTRDIPVIMVTARTDEIDRVVGFELGADDYVTKPFSIRELLLRVRRTLQRRLDPSVRGKVHHDTGMVQIDREAHRVWIESQEIELSLLEFRLLEALSEQNGRVMTREMLHSAVWGHDRTVSLRTIDAHIKRLRDRLGSAGICVETVRGVGYRYFGLTGSEPTRRRDG